MPSANAPILSIPIPPLNIIPANSALNAKPSMSTQRQQNAQRRARSGSIVAVQEVGGDQQVYLDQSAFRNLNTEWVNGKGAWLIHVVLIVGGKLLVDSIPGMQQNLSWTIITLTYMGLSYLMFHYVTGIPFGSDSHGGAYDDLTLWEQIDEGAQYTPAKKWLVCTPIALFLLSTHYTHYNPWAFAANFSATLFVLLAKLPQFHRQRLRFLPAESVSGMATPVTPYPPSLANSGRTTPTNSFM